MSPKYITVGSNGSCIFGKAVCSNLFWDTHCPVSLIKNEAGARNKVMSRWRSQGTMLSSESTRIENTE